LKKTSWFQLEIAENSFSIQSSPEKKVFPESVADFNHQVLIILNFLLFPDFVAEAKGICVLGVIAFLPKKGGRRYGRIPFDSNC
jgi:hypothetical protein